MPFRVFLALADDPKDRGTIVAHGGGKVGIYLSLELIRLNTKNNLCGGFLGGSQALIPLALEGTETGKIKACHALAKIAAVSKPDIAFPGERVRTVKSVCT